MTSFRLAAGAITLLASAPLAADAPTPLVLRPTSDWVLDYADERCSLMRAFGEDDQLVTLQIDSFGQPHRFRVLLSGRLFPRSTRATGEIRYGLTSDPNELHEATTLEGVSNDIAAIAFESMLGPPVDRERQDDAPEADLAAARTTYLAGLAEYRERIDRIALRLRGDRAIDLQLGSMKPPLAALETCIDDLYAAWGFDPARLRALTKWPAPIAATVRNLQRRYPSDMILNGTNAYVPVRVMVDAEGRGTQCVVQVESVDQAFKDAVCAGMARGFEPARDAAGAAVAAPFQTAVLFLVNGR